MCGDWVIAPVDRGVKPATADMRERLGRRHLRPKCGMRDRGCKQSGAEGLVYSSMPMR
jgi:hypothetical protein